MNIIKYHPISDSHGYAVEKTQKGKYQIVYVSRFVSSEGNEHFKLEGKSAGNGKLHVYPSPFIADHVIRREILPRYKKVV